MFPPKRIVIFPPSVSGRCSEGLDAFIFFLKHTSSRRITSYLSFTSNELDVQNGWEENTHTHTNKVKMVGTEIQRERARERLGQASVKLPAVQYSTKTIQYNTVQ